MKSRDQHFIAVYETLRALSPKTGAGVLVVATAMLVPGLAPSAPLLLSLVGERDLARTYNALWAAGVSVAFPPLAPIVGLASGLQDALLDPIADFGKGFRGVF